MKEIEKATDANEQITIASLKNEVFEEFRFICEENEIDLTGGQIAPRVFGFVLEELNNRLIAPRKEILLYYSDSSKIDKYSNTRYDPIKIYVIYRKILNPLCRLYNQILTIDLFILFMGIEKNILNSIIIYTGNCEAAISKVINLETKTGLKEYLFERKGNPLGILATLKNEHDFENPTANKGEMDANRLLSADNLPKLQ